MGEHVIKVHSGNKEDQLKAVARLVDWGIDTYGKVEISIRQEKRSTEQNDLMWAILTDISKQVEWAGAHLSPEEWKDLASGSFNNCKVLPSLDNQGVVVVGLSTSRIGKRKFSDFIEYLYAFGSERGVEWSQESIDAREQYGNGKQEA